MALPATAVVQDFGEPPPGAPPGATRRVGAVLGAYRLVTELGEGGMGTVYYAEHVTLGRRAAVKVLRPEIARDPEVVHRFFREARAANTIGHPGIVDVTDLGTTDEGVHFLVMEMLEGETLGARIERTTRLAPADAVRLLVEAADALAAAHARGIVHRDLKPENLFLAHDGSVERVKVLDFGIAKLTGRDDDGRHTKTGLVLGTPAYMSPDQCLGEKDLDARSDVYSLGVVAFEALTGRPPFSAGSVGKLIVAHTHEAPVAPSSLEGAVPARLDEVVLRALAKKREDRFADMAAMRDALRDALTARPAHLARVPAVSGEVAIAAVEAAQTRSVGARLREIICARLAEDRLKLPSMPVVVMRALGMLKDADVPIAKLAQTLEADPLLVPRLLRVANNAAYGSSPAATVHQAVARLGVRRLRALLTEAAAREVFTSTDPEIARSFRVLWDHCTSVATVARTLARGEPVDGEELYLAALLHDVGKPVVGALLLETERGLLGELGAAWMGRSLWEKIVDDAHRDVGVALAKKWKLPQGVVSAIGSGGGEPVLAGPSSLDTWLGYAHALVVRDDARLVRLREHLGGTPDREQAALGAADEATATR